MLSPVQDPRSSFSSDAHITHNTHIHTYTHTHIHTYTHIHIRTYTHTHIHTYTHTHKQVRLLLDCADAFETPRRHNYSPQMQICQRVQYPHIRTRWRSPPSRGNSSCDHRLGSRDRRGLGGFSGFRRFRVRKKAGEVLIQSFGRHGIKGSIQKHVRG
jgi:hypothetical protein